MKAIFIRTIFFLASIWSFSSSGFADDWCHASLRATDGTSIQIDYRVRQYRPMRMPTYWTMTNIYVHVENSQFIGTESISAVFMTTPNGIRPQGGEAISDLPFDGARYTASGSDVEYGSYVSIVKPVGNDGGGPSYHFEVALVVDGKWLKDPVTGESNFKFFANEHPIFCAN